MTARYATPEEVDTWNDHIIANPDGGNILQGPEFIEQKVKAGWTARYVFIDSRAVAIIEKSVPLLGKVWYCPKGPSTTSVSDLKKLVESLRQFAKANGVFTIKIEPELPHDTDLSMLGLQKTTPVQQHFATVWVDIAGSEDEILTSLPQKGRHAIRRAERDGVTVRAVETNQENCLVMYSLLKGTAIDAGFIIRPPDYYRDFYLAYSEADLGQLFFAYFEGQVVAAAFAMVFGTKSIYKDGASIRDRKAYGASHLLQWHVIKWAKSKGATQHDLCGVPPIASITDQNHPFYGLGRFKTSFNKEVTEYVGAYEIPVVRWKSRLWQRYIEKVVKRLYFKRHHQSYY